MIFLYLGIVYILKLLNLHNIFLSVYNCIFPTEFYYYHKFGNQVIQVISKQSLLNFKELYAHAQILLSFILLIHRFLVLVLDCKSYARHPLASPTDCYPQCRSNNGVIMLNSSRDAKQALFPNKIDLDWPGLQWPGLFWFSDAWDRHIRLPSVNILHKIKEKCLLRTF